MLRSIVSCGSRPLVIWTVRRERPPSSSEISRARLATVIVGNREVIQRAARTPDTGRRHSRLTERLTRQPVASP